MSDDGPALVRLPDEHRTAFRDPLGPIYTDVSELIADAGEPIVAVGDMVAHHLTEAGRPPDLAVIDGRTERRAVDPDVEDRLAAVPATELHATNPPGTITVELIRAIRDGLQLEPPVQVIVDGEEDLATLPAVLTAPDGATVVYGQPGEGMVRIDVDGDGRRKARELFSLLQGDVERVRGLVPE